MQPSRALMLVMTLSLSACATMSPDECRLADWYLIGELDARSGRTPAHLSQRDRDCREAGFPADQVSWREGWEQGLTVFCTSQQGFRFGREGGRYEPICPASLEPVFLTGFDLGRQFYVLTERVSGVRGEITGVETRIREGRRSGKLEDEQLSELQRERRKLQTTLQALELELAELNGLARGLGFL